MKYVSMIIPAYNESGVIEKTIKHAMKTGLVDEIIVVDDGSIDDTLTCAKRCGVKVLQNEVNQGKSKALIRGLAKATGEIIVFLDADLGSSAGEVAQIIKPVVHGKCDVSIARFGAAKRKGGFGIVRWVSRWGVKRLCGKYIQSVLSGQRAFKRDVLKEIKMGSGYGAEVAMTIDILRKGYHIEEYDVEMTHKETGRDLAGFLHRARQFKDIVKVLIVSYKQ